MSAAPIRYARSGDVNVAYQVTGEGPFDLVLVPGFFSPRDRLVAPVDGPRVRAARVVREAHPLRQERNRPLRPDGRPPRLRRADGRRPCRHGCRGERAGRALRLSEGGPLCVLFAATYPERTRALALYGTYAKRRDPDDDYPWAPTRESRLSYAQELESTWGENVDISRMSPGADEALSSWYQRRGRASLSPAAARDLILMNSQADVRHVLPTVQCPTLVLHRSGDRDSRPDEGRYIADRIPGATFVELAGEDHMPAVRPDEIVDEIEEFLTGVRPAPSPDRVLATVLFTDLVGSTERAQALGDATWTSLLASHNDAVRRALARFSGEEIDTAGEGFLAAFDGPARAIRCAFEIREALRALGLDVRAGVHTGEVERRPGEKPRGIAVHVGARVMSLAAAGEVLVSSTTRDLVAGSGLDFDDRGEHELKGIDGQRHLFAAP